MDQGNNNSNNSNPDALLSGTPGNFGVNPPATPPPAPLDSVSNQPTSFPEPPASSTPDFNTPPSFIADTPPQTTPLSDQKPPLAPSSIPSDPIPNPSQPTLVNDTGGLNWANPVASPNTNASSTVSQPLPATPTSFNPFSSPEAEVKPSEPVQPENAPTDLSHLVNSNPETTNGNVLSQPEFLVAPQETGNEINQAVPASSGAGGFPKIILIIGGVILLAVIAASAYFILGIGKPPESLPVSLPVEQQASPTPVAQITEAPASTGSASFSNLPGSNATQSANPSQSGAGSAYSMLLRGRNSTPSANQ